MSSTTTTSLYLRTESLLVLVVLELSKIRVSFWSGFHHKFQSQGSLSMSMTWKPCKLEPTNLQIVQQIEIRVFLKKIPNYPRILMFAFCTWMHITSAVPSNKLYNKSKCDFSSKCANYPFLHFIHAWILKVQYRQTNCTTNQNYFFNLPNYPRILMFAFYTWMDIKSALPPNKLYNKSKWVFSSKFIKLSSNFNFCILSMNGY